MGLRVVPFSDDFKDASNLGANCAAAPPQPRSTTSVLSTATSTSSSTPSGTLGTKPTIGAYTFQGCYTEGDGVRALAAASFL